jgi:BirA family biotin operon repressor/biotin-[acetyl-CoA-carboxylase] ligase
MEFFKSIVYMYEASSTMDVAKNLSNFFEIPFAIRASVQSAGRGQYGRKWSSSLGGLFFTEVLDLKNILGFSTFLSIPIIRVLREYVPEIKVKWPNDIVLGRKKLAGILVEKSNYVFAGVGINISNDISEVESISVRLSDFSTVEPEQIFIEILEMQSILMPIFLESGFESFREEYNKNLIFLGEKIKVDVGHIIEGTVIGVGKNGELILKTIDGIKEVYSGSVVNFYQNS